jgi:hypothetical protein
VAIFAFYARLELPRTREHTGQTASVPGAVTRFCASCDIPLYHSRSRMFSSSIGRTAGPASQAAGAGDACGVSDDNMLTLLQANSACVCRRGGADLELSHQGSESLHRTSGRCRIRRPRNVWYRPATWPKLMAYSISIIQNADYLTPQQKRDILYNNDARFLRLDGK